jgi:hypothetical protein
MLCVDLTEEDVGLPVTGQSLLVFVVCNLIFGVLGHMAVPDIAVVTLYGVQMVLLDL